MDDLAPHRRCHFESIRHNLIKKVWHLYKIFLQSAILNIHSILCTPKSAKIVCNKGDMFKHWFTSRCADKSSLFSKCISALQNKSGKISGQYQYAFPIGHNPQCTIDGQELGNIISTKRSQRHLLFGSDLLLHSFYPIIINLEKWKRHIFILKR